MAPLLTPRLHSGTGPAVSVVEYLFRLTIHLVGVGVVAVVVFAVSGLIEGLRFSGQGDRSDEPAGGNPDPSPDE